MRAPHELGFRWLEIREKYGSLRIDWEVQKQSCSVECLAILGELTHAVEQAESASEATCQLRGAPGKVDDLTAGS